MVTRKVSEIEIAHNTISIYINNNIIYNIIIIIAKWYYLGNVVVKNIKDSNNEKNGGGKCLRTCASIVFSTIGVGAILVSYIFCGAILFLTLEGNGEYDIEKKNGSLQKTLMTFTMLKKRAVLCRSLPIQILISFMDITTMIPLR